MPLVNAKCTNCGAPLQVDSTHDAAICQYCGSAFIVEKAIQNYNYSFTTNINAQNIIITGKGEMEKERLLQNARTNENFKEYEKASEIYKQVTEDYPDDYRGWYGTAAMKTHEFIILDLDDSEFNEISKCIDKALLCAPQSQCESINTTWKAYLKKHFDYLDKKKRSIQDLKNRSSELETQINEISIQINSNKQKLVLKSNEKLINLFLASMAAGVGIMILAAIINSVGLVFIGLLFTIGFFFVYLFYKASIGSQKAYIKANSKRINKLIDDDTAKLNKLQNENKSINDSISFIKNKYHI